MLNRTRKPSLRPTLVGQAPRLSLLALLLLAPLASAQPNTTPPPQSPANPSLPAHPPISAYSETSIDGFRILIDPTSESSNPLRHHRLLAAVTFDLDIILERIPAGALAVLRQTPIVLTTFTEPRGAWKGRGCCFHASAAWLTSNGYDAQREGVVEVMNADDYLQWRAEQPMMLLHELTHAFHARLDVNRADIKAAYEHAKAANLYGPVAYALNEPGKTRDAYARTNPTEYFSEITEAYFGRNDFFPFTRADLKTYDPDGYALVERIWNLSADQLKLEIGPRAAASSPAPNPQSPPPHSSTPKPH